MATQPAGLPRTEGWFRACSIGASQPAGTASSLAVAPGGARGTEGHSVLLAGNCSEYSARLAELMYTCTHHALAFLLASSPQVGCAGSSGPG